MPSITVIPIIGLLVLKRWNHEYIQSTITQQLYYSLLLSQLQFLGKFNIKFDNQISSRAGFSSYRHTFSSQHSSCLGRNDLIEVEIDELSVKFFLTKDRVTTVIDLESRASIKVILAVQIKLSPYLRKPFQLTYTMLKINID